TWSAQRPPLPSARTAQEFRKEFAKKSQALRGSLSGCPLLVQSPHSAAIEAAPATDRPPAVQKGTTMKITAMVMAWLVAGALMTAAPVEAELTAQPALSP